MGNFKEDIARTRAFVFDVDGVLTLRTEAADRATLDGRVAFTFDGVTAELLSLSVTDQLPELPTEVPLTQNGYDTQVYEPKTGLVLSPTVAAEGDGLSAADTAAGERRPATLIKGVFSDLTVTDRGSRISLKEYLSRLDKRQFADKDHPFRGEKSAPLCSLEQSSRRSAALKGAAEAKSSHFRKRKTLHGFPAATQNGGMFFVTTLPAPIVQPSPISTPGSIIAPAPIQQFAPMWTGRLYCQGLSPLSSGSIGWPAATITTFGPSMEKSPMKMCVSSTRLRPWLMYTFFPRWRKWPPQFALKGGTMWHDGPHSASMRERSSWRSFPS